MQILRVPSHVAMLGYTLTHDGDTYDTWNSDQEHLGSFPRKDDALAFLESAAEAEILQLDALPQPLTEADIAAILS